MDQESAGHKRRHRSRGRGREGDFEQFDVRKRHVCAGAARNTTRTQQIDCGCNTSFHALDLGYGAMNAATMCMSEAMIATTMRNWALSACDSRHCAASAQGRNAMHWARARASASVEDRKRSKNCALHSRARVTRLVPQHIPRPSWWAMT